MKRYTFFVMLFITYIFVFSSVNRSDYSIFVQLDDSAKIMSGYEEITYYNNSPDTLNSIVFHMYANMFGRDFEYFSGRKKPAPGDEGYIVIDSLFIDSVKMENGTLDYTLFSQPLDENLMPGDSNKIKVYFTHKIPKPYLREGFGKDKYDISQWYPKIAVYTKGKWADFQAHKHSEFFGEYGNYRIHITMPSKYMAFGTGNIIGPEQELSLLDSIRAAGEYNGEGDTVKTVIMEARNVNDFAFVLRKAFKIFYNDSVSPAIEIIADKEQFESFREQADNISNAIAYYSDKYYPYPYETFTVAQGMLQAGGGMEYPQFTVIADMGIPQNSIIKTYMLEEVIAHEISHQWFYLILGTNEADEPFMDEAFAVYSENEYMEDKYGLTDNYILLLGRPLLSLFDMNYLSYRLIQTSGLSEPVNLPAYEYEDFFSYGRNVYSKGYLIVRNIEALLGEQAFEDMMRAYFNDYAFSHPDIDDFVKYVNEYTANEYIIEIKHLIEENIYTDYYIKGIKEINSDYTLTVGNHSPFDMPVDIQFIYEDGTDTIIRKMPGEDLLSVQGKTVSNVIIDPKQRFLDTDYYNNIKRGRFKFHFLELRPDYFKTDVYFAPWVDHTLIDGFSAGLTAYMCDYPTIMMNPYSIYGKWSLGVFAGYNEMEQFLYRHRLLSYQGEAVKTRFRHMISYSPSVFRMENSVMAFTENRGEDQSNYSIEIFEEYMLNDGSSYYAGILGPRKYSIIGLKYRYSKEIGKFNIYAQPEAMLSDEIIYSSSQFQKFCINTGLSFTEAGLIAGIGVNSKVTFGDLNQQNSYYLYSSPLTLFNPVSAGSSYTFDMVYANGEGYVTQLYGNTAFRSMHTLDIYVGSGIIEAYFDLFSASEDGYLSRHVLYQTGVRMRLGNILSINIPLYNDEIGFIAGQSFTVSLSSGIIR